LALFAVNQCVQTNKKVVIIVSHDVIAEKRCSQLIKLFPKKKVGKTFEELNKYTIILANMDIILTTASAWDVLSRRWKARKGFNEIGLILIDNLHLLS
jgi:replicative superfamily II helicase